MILQRISLRDFKRFAQFEARFTPGLNVVIGDNEEGKSTLREAITIAFFESPSTTKEEILAHRRWRAAEQFAIDLEFTENDRTYLLSKDFQTRTACLRDLHSGERLTDARAVSARIREFLGLPSKDAFESTVRVSQRDITQLKQGSQIADRLQELVTGGEQDVRASAILDQLDKALKALTTTARTSPGPLAILPGEIARREADLVAKSQSLSRAEVDARTLTSTQASLEAARRELDEKRASADACRRRLDLEEEFAGALKDREALDARVEQVRDLQDAVAAAEADLGRHADVLGLSPERIAEIAALEMQAKAAGAATLEAASVPTAGARPGRGWIVAGVLLAVLGIAGGIYYPPLLALALAGAGIILWDILRSRQDGAAAAALATQMRAEERRQTAEANAQRLSALLTQAGCSTTADLHARRAQAEDLRGRAAEGNAKIDGLLAGKTVPDLEAARKAASRKARDLDEHLAEPTMRLAVMDQAAYHQLQKEIAELDRRIPLLGETLQALQVAVRVNQVSIDEVHSLEEEVQELRELLVAARERQQILSITRGVLDEARAATMVSAGEVLETELGSLVSEITCGRYSRVAVDPSKLGIKLLSPAKDAPVDVTLDGDLSTGTVEQVYLAARLAIARLLARDRRPPFILDDPFVTFDAPRTQAVLSLCKRLSADSQIILFTCHEAYQPFADNVVRLPGLGTSHGSL